MALRRARSDDAAVDHTEASMRFKAIALDPEQFVSWVRLNDEELHERHARRRVADEEPGFPCRVSLQDAPAGERLILLPFEHQPADSPYRASGPIFVRERTSRWPATVGVVPPILRPRLLSLRAYDANGMMQDADVVEGKVVEQRFESMFADPAIDYLHVHFARRGCYACRIERA
jgi:hypothetical protein